MVRNYVRKTQRQSWDQESMADAVENVVYGVMGYTKAAETFGIPRGTLVKRVKIYRGNPDRDLAVKKKMGAYTKVFTDVEENELAEYVKTMEARLFGLTTRELRGLAFELAERNKKLHPFDRESRLAGLEWLHGFFKRHPDLSLRKPEATSAARAMGFNKVVVSNFFKLLTEVVDKHHLTPDQIFNVDETGITTVQKSHSKVIAARGRRQVGALTSAERGLLVTAEICVGADGSYMPPMLIFPRKRMQPHLMNGSPPGAWGECHPSGWIQTDLFLSWFRRFIQFSRATKEHPVLLLLDGHATHTKNLKLIDLARDNGVILICFPPHCTHRLQPLDVSFMKPLSIYYSAEMKKWLRCNPGRVVTQSEIAGLFGSAFLQAATMPTAINGFRKTGIWPLNPDVFTEDDFLPAETTDIVLVDEGVTVSTEPQPGCSTWNANPLTSNSTETADSGANSTLNADIPISTPSTRSHTEKSAFIHSPDEVIPIPRVTKSNPRTNRRRGKTAVLTSSPYRKELLAQQNVKRPATKRKSTSSKETTTILKKKPKSQAPPTRQLPIRKTQVQRRILVEDTTTEEDSS